MRDNGQGGMRKAGWQDGEIRRPMLREEISHLDSRLLGLIKKRAVLNGGKNADIAALSAFAADLGCDRQLCERLFQLLEKSAFNIHKNVESLQSGEDGRRSTRNDMDRQIMLVLSKRQKLLAKLCSHGRMAVDDEKFLRENWQKTVRELEGDSILAAPVFVCLQGLGSPDNHKSAQDPFTLYSAHKSVKLSMPAPLDFSLARKWLWLASSAGQPLQLAPVMSNDALADFIAILDQLGASPLREVNAISLPAAQPLPQFDRIVHVGSDPFNLYLLICHYLGAHSRVKITGGTGLQLLDLSFLRHILPLLGARPVHLIPKSTGLPLRIECSGILPPSFTASSDLPLAFVEALLLCAPFYLQPFAVDLSPCPDAAQLLENVCPLLEQAGASFSIADMTLNFTPAPVVIPPSPKVPMELELALFLLAMAEACSGEVKLTGILPVDAAAWVGIFNSCGTGWNILPDGLVSHVNKPLFSFIVTDAAKEMPFLSHNTIAALFACLSAIAVYNGGTSALPGKFAEIVRQTGFFSAAGIALDAKGALGLASPDAAIIAQGWNAPDAIWAMALGIAGLCSRRRVKLKLANPGIMRSLWSGFWQFLNRFTAPETKVQDPSRVDERKSRRIRTQAVAVPPEIREEDWDR